MQTRYQKALTYCWEIASFASGCLFLQHRLLKVVWGFVCERVVCANTRILTFIWISKRNVRINWERTWKRLEGKTVSTGCIMSSLRCGGMSAISQREGGRSSLLEPQMFLNYKTTNVLWVPEPRRGDPRGTVVSSVYFCTLNSSWSAFLNLLNETLLETITTPLFSSLPFHFPFLSFKQTQTLFSSFLFPFHDPFPLLHTKFNLSFLSILFSFPIPTFLYFRQTQILFLSTYHFLSFFISLIWTWYSSFLWHFVTSVKPFHFFKPTKIILLVFPFHSHFISFTSQKI